MRLILSVCAEILQSDRSLVVPALGALTEIVLPESLRVRHYFSYHFGMRKSKL